MGTELARPLPAPAIGDASGQPKNGRPSYRRGYSRGTCYDASFVPSAAAADLTTAAHLQAVPVRATVRLGCAGSGSRLTDVDRPMCTLAVRFHLPDGGRTDLIAVGFAGAAAKVPAPVSYATTMYWASQTFRWCAADGTVRSVRCRWVPEAREHLLDPAAPAARRLTFELRERLARGPVEFGLRVRLGEPDAEGTEITAGRLAITAEVTDRQYWAAQVFDPALLTAGIEPPGPARSARGAGCAVPGHRRGH